MPRELNAQNLEKYFKRKKQTQEMQTLSSHARMLGVDYDQHFQKIEKMDKLIRN